MKTQLLALMPSHSTLAVTPTPLLVQALLNNTIGGNNIGLGYNAGSNLTTGSNNIDIGSAGVAGEAANYPHRLRTGTQSSAFIAGILWRFHGNWSWQPGLYRLRGSTWNSGLFEAS